MNTYIVTYDLHVRGQNYSCLTNKLKAYGTHFHMQGSVWIVSTNQTAIQVRDNLQSCLDNNDNIFVGKLNGEAAWSGFTEAENKWLRDVLS